MPAIGGVVDVSASAGASGTCVKVVADGTSDEKSKGPGSALAPAGE